MVKSYKLKIYANKGKLARLERLIEFWHEHVNTKIKMFWDFAAPMGTYPPSAYCLGGRLKRDASLKAWQLVKTAKQLNQERPVYDGREVEFNAASFKILEHMTPTFDFWVSVTHLESWNRLILPCKKTGHFNRAIGRGELRKSAKIIKHKKNFYLQLYVVLPEQNHQNEQLLGIDVGLNHTAVTSKAEFYGEDLRALRIRTKWRKYGNRTSPFKQGLNRIAKEIIKHHPQTDFALESFVIEGKTNRNRAFRRRNKNWAYQHLGKTLEGRGHLEGFQVIWVQPENTSITCPICKHVDKANRYGDRFRCRKCDYQGHADAVGAINISHCGRVARKHSVSYPKGTNPIKVDPTGRQEGIPQIN